MKNLYLTRAVRFAILSAGAAAISAPAVAQQQLEEVVVTGSRIQRTDLSSVSPLSVVSNEEFQISGNLNVEQKLAELPLTLPAFGPSSNNPGDGTARVDLRGLGTFRTLVLVNGRRYIPATQTGVVDLNTIPGSLIKQVDVLTGGASAVYGSDALAGVVNFQLKDDFEGVEISSLYDITSEGDAEKFNADLTIGGNFANGKGNAVLYFGYSDREALFADERPFSSLALTPANPVGTPGQDSATGAGGPLTGGGSAGIPGTLFVAPTVDPGTPGDTSDDFAVGRFTTDGEAVPFLDPQDRFNYAPDNFLQLPQQRFLMSAFAHYDINDHATAYAELSFAHNEVPQELAPTPAFLSTVEVNPDSPFFGDNISAALDGSRSDTNGDTVIDDNDNAFLGFVGRRMVENGSRQALDTRDAFRVLLGSRGDVAGTWGYDAYYSYAQLENSNLLNNDVSDTRFRQAVLVTDDGMSCQDPSGGCVPLNIFGEGNITEAAVGFINVGAANVTSIQQQVFNTTFSGEVATISQDAGPIGAAIGFEYRKDESSFRPDEFLSAGDVLGFNAGAPTIGEYDVTEFFGEIDVPLVSGVTGAESLSVWAAARRSDYSNIGTVNSYAGALNWAPVEMVRFRAGIQQAVRAPNVSELFLGQANGFPGADDPCSAGGTAGTGGGNATLTMLCEQSGVPVGQVGVFNQTNAQIEGVFGGNPNLKEEESDTTTLGLVIQPLDGLDITIDYFDIEVKDAISVLGGSVDGVLDICYNQVQDLSSPFCQAVTRRSNGNVDTVNVLNENIGKIETSGYDINVNYVTDMQAGLFGGGSTLAVNVRSTYLDTYDVTPVADLDGVDICAGAYGNTCGSPRNQLQVNTRVSWNTGPLGLSMLWRYLKGAEDDRIPNGGVVPSTLSVPYIDDISYVDLSASYDFTDSFRVNLGIKNVFDEQTTFVGDDANEQSNTFPEVYDVIGPRYFVSASYHFE